MTHADGYFAIGKTHTVCQDYVRCGTLPEGRSYAIVSDGCSSSKDTDIGARVLVLAAESYIQQAAIPLNQLAFGQIIEAARTVVMAMGIHSDCLDATLIIAIETETQVLVYKMGDGVVATRRRDGTWGYEYHEFMSGAPYYPNYLRDEPRHEAYRNQPDDSVKCFTGNASNEAKVTLTLHDYAMTLGLPIVFDKADVDLVVLTTDGACSFRKGLDPVPVADVIRQIVDVKVPTGEFMIRRAKRFLGNYCTTQGWHHDDDFGVGAIYIDAGTP